MIDIRYPNISAKTDREKIEQIHRYLYYLVEQLNYGLPNLGIVDATTQSAAIKSEEGVPGKKPVKGKDYFTEADKAEMVSAVISALPVYDGEVVSV